MGEMLHGFSPMHVALDIAKGMVKLHGGNWVHRDLKSKNVLINEQWRACVADFGETTEVMRRGTPMYMAPEQLMADTALALKIDVYAFGVVLWELITWQLPFIIVPTDDATDSASRIGTGMVSPVEILDSSRGGMRDGRWSTLTSLWSKRGEAASDEMSNIGDGLADDESSDSVDAAAARVASHSALVAPRNFRCATYVDEMTPKKGNFMALARGIDGDRGGHSGGHGSIGGDMASSWQPSSMMASSINSPGTSPVTTGLTFKGGGASSATKPARRKWFSAPSSTKEKMARASSAQRRAQDLIQTAGDNANLVTAQGTAAPSGTAVAAAARAKATGVGAHSRTLSEGLSRTREETLENEDEAQRWVWSEQMRPPVPRRCPQVLQELLNRCWDQDPMKRPSFMEICTHLEEKVLGMNREGGDDETAVEAAQGETSNSSSTPSSTVPYTYDKSQFPITVNPRTLPPGFARKLLKQREVVQLELERQRSAPGRGGMGGMGMGFNTAPGGLQRGGSAELRAAEREHAAAGLFRRHGSTPGASDAELEESSSVYAWVSAESGNPSSGTAGRSSESGVQLSGRFDSASGGSGGSSGGGAGAGGRPKGTRRSTPWSPK